MICTKCLQHLQHLQHLRALYEHIPQSCISISPAPVLPLHLPATSALPPLPTTLLSTNHRRMLEEESAPRRAAEAAVAAAAAAAVPEPPKRFVSVQAPTRPGGAAYQAMQAMYSRRQTELASAPPSAAASKVGSGERVLSAGCRPITPALSSPFSTPIAQTSAARSTGPSSLAVTPQSSNQQLEHLPTV